VLVFGVPGLRVLEEELDVFERGVVAAILTDHVGQEILLQRIMGAFEMFLIKGDGFEFEIEAHGNHIQVRSIGLHHGFIFPGGMMGSGLVLCFS
jgi:hypothetical protein